MALITFNFRDYLGDRLENSVCKVKPTLPDLSGSTVRIPAAIFVSDGETIELSNGTYLCDLSGNNTTIRGYFVIDGTDSALSSIFQTITDATVIPIGTPLSAISGLQAALDSKLPIDDPRLDLLLTQSERTKLSGISNGATANQTDAYLLELSNSTGELPISRVTGLTSELSGKASVSNLVSLEDEVNDLSSSFGSLATSVSSKLNDSDLSPLRNSLILINGQITNLSASQITVDERAKLSGISTGATVNSTDSFLRDRVNHTGSQSIGSITGLQTAIDGKVNLTDTRLSDARNPLAHTHPISDIVNLATELTGKASASDLVATNLMVAGLTTDKFTTSERAKLTGIQANATANSTDGFLRDRSNHTGNQPISTVTGLQTSLDGKANLTDPRFSDSRNPLTHTQPISSISNLDIELTGKASAIDLAATNLTVAGLVTDKFTAAERTKLSGISTGATANQTNTFLVARGNHTGTQPIGTVDGLQAALDSKATRSGDATFATLSSSRYNLGLDISLVPVVENPSIIHSWWGMVLGGYSGDYRIATNPSDPQARNAAVMIKSVGINPPDYVDENLTRGHTGLIIKQATWQNTSSRGLRINAANGNTNVEIDYLGNARLNGKLSARSINLTNSLPDSPTDGDIALSNGTLNIRNNGAWNPVSASSTNPGFNYVQSTEPATPTDRQTWREVGASGNSDWVWISQINRWASIQVEGINSQIHSNLGADQTSTLACPRIGSGIWIEGAVMAYRLSVASTSAALQWRFDLMSQDLQLNSVAIGGTEINTVGDLGATNYLKPLFTSGSRSDVFFWNDLLGLQWRVRRSGTINMSGIGTVIARYIR